MKNIIFKKTLFVSLVIFLTHCGGSHENLTTNPPQRDSLEKPKESIVDIFQLPKEDDLLLRNIQELPIGDYKLTQIQGYAKASEDIVFVKFEHKLATPGELTSDLDTLTHKLILKEEFLTAFNISLKLIKSEKEFLNKEQVSYSIQLNPMEKKWSMAPSLDINLFSFEKNIKINSNQRGIYILDANTVYIALNENKLKVYVKSKGDRDEVYLQFEYQKFDSLTMDPAPTTDSTSNPDVIPPSEPKKVKKTPSKAKDSPQKPINDVADANEFLTTFNRDNKTAENKFKVECDPTLGLDLCLPALKELNKIRANLNYPQLKIIISENMGTLDFKNQLNIRFKASSTEMKAHIDKEMNKKKDILQKIKSQQSLARKYYSSVSCDEKLVTPEDCLIAINKLVGEIASGVNDKSYKIIISDKNRRISKNVINLSYYQKIEDMAGYILDQLL
ncbi:MAG TPA: hypothetical protein PLJ21_02640 [Pseudobdellovibrionaceae bacterium]|nr:hypothetical protein [Pseudobdellovibrionaceae bacterium]